MLVEERTAVLVLDIRAVAVALKYFAWVFNKGDQMAVELDYVPLPASLKQQVRDTWKSGIKTKDGKVLLNLTHQQW
jgi:hypothetical protein